MNLGVVSSIKGVPIRLTEERWEHILLNHLEFSYYDMDAVLDAVENPDFLLSGRAGSLVAVVVLGRYLPACILQGETHDRWFHNHCAYSTRVEQELDSMAKVRTNIVAPPPLDQDRLLRLAEERGVLLPDVHLTLDYQADVDLLSIRFDKPVKTDSIADDDELGVIGIYDQGMLVGVEILDITGNLEHANPR